MKNILFAVCGLSPQVITEALYALHQEGRCVDEINIITTRDGRECIDAQLLSPHNGHYYRYMRDYKIDPAQIAFDATHVHVITDEDGREIEDIIDEDDNKRLLQKCLELTFSLTSADDNAVFFLVAGGRKTMSSCLTVAAQIYGRPQDRIYHVLISPEFESNRDFFYPPLVPVEIELRDKKGEPYSKKTSYAAITLIPMPFISIRNRLSDKWLKAPYDPATLMLSLVREAKPTITADLPGKKLIYKGIEIDMQPSLLALYAFFLLKKKECTLARSNCKNCHDCYLSIQDVYTHQGNITDIYHSITRRISFIIKEGIRIGNINAEAFNQYKAKIRKDLKQSFGIQVLPRLEIESHGKRPDTRYGIAMDKKQIRIVL